jgi:hypothetical protein
MSYPIGRTYDAAPPVVTPNPVGLYQVAEVVDESGTALLGVAYESVGIHLPRITVSDGSSAWGSASKTFDGIDFEQGDYFQIYEGVTGALRDTDNFETLAADRLAAFESMAVEKYLWENLYGPKAVAQGGDLNSAGALTPHLALGLLEEFAGHYYSGKATIHVGRRGATSLQHSMVLDDDGVSTKSGNKLANGAGYFSPLGPAALTAGAGNVWVYVTGEVKIRRGPVETAMAPSPSTNQKVGLAERFIVPTIDVIAAAVRMSL